MDDDDILDTLNDLIETCKDGEYGFRSCAEHAKSGDLAALLTRRAEDCRLAAGELQGHVVALGSKPETGGTVPGALHRGWVSVRSTLAAYDDLAVLDECERGERTAVAKYGAALEKPLPEPLLSVIERQYEGAERNLEQVRALRDSLQLNR